MRTDLAILYAHDDGERSRMCGKNRDSAENGGFYGTSVRPRPL